MTYGIVEDGEFIARFAAPTNVRSNRPVFASDTLSLKRLVSRRSAHRWEIESNLEPLTAGANDLFAHLVEMGTSETVTVRVPQNYGVILKRTSMSTPTAVGAKGATTVTVTNNSGLIPRGTLVRFDSHSKIYMLTKNCSGNGVMRFYPPLRAAVNGIFKHRDDVEMPCTYDTDTLSGAQYTDGIMMDIGTVKLIERL
jgi:hypothetical protein